MPRIVKCGLIQASMACGTEESIETIRYANTEKTLGFVEQAAREGVQMLCMQEIFTGPYFCAEQNPRWYEAVERIPDGPTVKLMQEQAKSMRHLVADLLALSTLESEQYGIAETTFAVAPLVGALLADAHALSGGVHDISAAQVEAAEVTGSRDEIASAFGNLVSNAIRYTPPRGRIMLGFRVDDDGSGVFSVQDSGIGIAPEHIPRLTERFYRVDRSRSRATGGTGLGLAIVKHVLLRHQATLEIDSIAGSGSTFSVRLPASRVRRVVLPDAEAVPLSQSPSNERASDTR